MPVREKSSRKSSRKSSVRENASDHRPIVLITGAAGNLGRSLGAALCRDYRIVGLDLSTEGADFPVIEADFTSDAAVELAFWKFRDAFGSDIASVIHLAAYFDFTGKDNPLYRTVNVEGTRRLLRALQDFNVGQFVYSSTMLVHAPCDPGERIDEGRRVEPRWAYPQSKAEAENVVRAEHKKIPYVILRLAGVYDEHSMVPTLAQQIARIYERDFQSYFYSGSTLVGQAMLHREDMLDAFCRAVDRRNALPPETEILVGEPDAVGYDALQDELGYLLHGANDWPTMRLPKAVAVAGSWAQGKLEPVIPDMIDKGEPPFIKPFMVPMADDHYALDIRRARDLLGWEPRHRLKDVLPRIVADFKNDPIGWYKANGVTPPAWFSAAGKLGENPEELSVRHEAQVRAEHMANRWAHFVNMGLGTWLVTQPPLINVSEPLLRWSELILGTALFVCAALALSWRAQWARWACAGIGSLVMAAPFLFSTATAAAYLSDTFVGALIFGLAVCTKPDPGPSALAALTGPEIPPGWSYNPSTWTQRLPIIVLALVGLYVSRYLAAYQLGHIPEVWEPFFAGSAADPRNGTEEIITSSVSKAWPVSDAAVGGYTYLLEILTGIVGSRARWRTMPWLVLLFGLMIAPLGITSIIFIVIQPIVIGTWSTLALIAAAAVLVQIPYSLDELLATLQFMRRRIKAGQSWLRVLLVGGTDEMPDPRHPAPLKDEFDRPPGTIVEDMIGSGVSLPWNLAVSAVIGLSLLFTRLTVGAEGAQANADHLIGSLVLTMVSIAAADVARPVRYVNALLGAALFVTPFVYGADMVATIASVVSGVALIALSVRRGPIRDRYGNWSRVLV
ncbi:NAD-dependent epimerase/dehydratase family protein [Bradyrhizobium sp. sBnM-33]|uniref:NAD-dependent epimerase/dehydratase family protein n=1 Tax=Bradyrhizobium sp. sBnM-33 TaxID=2831780 RepID=UPI001BCF93F8|nr:vitamin K epoxide reductase family protein [Bradyrhizobium sp. sBnM-33]WOH53259.1 NAD-dependent epimerase/dehydratase family protein [Bradyrhizobium sp. sBnM-33]